MFAKRWVVYNKRKKGNFNFMTAKDGCKGTCQSKKATIKWIKKIFLLFEPRTTYYAISIVIFVHFTKDHIVYVASIEENWLFCSSISSDLRAKWKNSENAWTRQRRTIHFVPTTIDNSMKDSKMIYNCFWLSTTEEMWSLFGTK